MSPATAGELFGGTRVDLGADDALAAARDFAPDLVIAETADFLGPLAASGAGVQRLSHGVGIALGPASAEVLQVTAAARAAERGIVRARPSATVDPWPDCRQRDGRDPSPDRVTIRPQAHEAGPGTHWRAPSFPAVSTCPASS
ncbi:hypothetical protein [uncultured Streptomyces sp.]|uniref:hypothetical protein n=1 Tax=uncultured Streptomyces sp. TaxID=174707 RepID=UPI0026114E14|nr:hypothetical protein [uncultured Streptomyces sp.]